MTARRRPGSKPGPDANNDPGKDRQQSTARVSRPTYTKFWKANERPGDWKRIDALEARIAEIEAWQVAASEVIESLRSIISEWVVTT